MTEGEQFPDKSRNIIAPAILRKTTLLRRLPRSPVRHTGSNSREMGPRRRPAVTHSRTSCSGWRLEIDPRIRSAIDSDSFVADCCTLTRSSSKVTEKDCSRLEEDSNRCFLNRVFQFSFESAATGQWRFERTSRRCCTARSRNTAPF